MSEIGDVVHLDVLPVARKVDFDHIVREHFGFCHARMELQAIAPPVDKRVLLMRAAERRPQRSGDGTRELVDGNCADTSAHSVGRRTRKQYSGRLMTVHLLWSPLGQCLHRIRLLYTEGVKSLEAGKQEFPHRA